MSERNHLEHPQTITLRTSQGIPTYIYIYIESHYPCWQSRVEHREVETAHALRHGQELHEAGAMLTIGRAQTCSTELEHRLMLNMLIDHGYINPFELQNR